jgi:Arm DNA-binding domain
VPKVRLAGRNINTFPKPASGRDPIDYYDEGPDAVDWFVLRVSAEGRRTFVVGYVAANGKKRRVTLGRFSDEFTLAIARGKAKEILARVALGGDPVAEEKAEKASAVEIASGSSSTVSEPPNPAS